MNWQFPYTSQRMPLFARNIVATSQPLAAQAGVDAFRRGGNAVDAALAAAITLAVVEPTSNGIGSDAFAIVHDGESLYGLNASGKSPAAWNPERFAGHNTMPQYGWDAVTVPGAVSAWAELSRRFGRLAFENLFDAAIHYARDGYHVSPITAAAWSNAHKSYTNFAEFQRCFCPNGRAPHPGELFASPEQARTLEKIASTNGEAFYRGEIAERIAQAANRDGGAMTIDDLAEHQPDWVVPIAVNFRNVQLHEIPPNGQGLAALIALGIIEHLNIDRYPVDSADSVHLQIEAMKSAFADAYRRIADADCMDCRPEDLLDPDYLKMRASEIDLSRAKDYQHGTPIERGTVYLSAADETGMMVSFIQSNFWGFGSGIVIPETGISMQNRGYGFVLDKGHPNQIAARKRPFHTIIPAFVTRENNPLMSFGVMGGSFQAQGHMQMMVRMFIYGQNPQAASDAPRWRIDRGLRVQIETNFNAQVADELRQRGHQIDHDHSANFGGAQLIYRLENNAYCAASDHRKDGQAAGY